MRRFRGLRRTVDFQRLRRYGRRTSAGALVIVRSELPHGDGLSLVGISIKKSIGKAVVRNKIRRRLAAILDEQLAGRAPLRLLIEARPEAATASFESLRTDLTHGLA